MEDAGGFWFGFGIWILIWICSLVFYIPMIQILALYLDFEGAKNIHVLQVLIGDFGGCWRFLTGVWHLDLDLDMVTGLWYTHDSNFGSLSWIWRHKEYACPWSPNLRLWKTLEVPDWGFASWYWFGYGHWSFVHLCSNFWLSIMILNVQRTSMSFTSSFGDFEDAGGPSLGLGILILIWIWSLVLIHPWSYFWLSIFISKMQRTSMSFKSSFGALGDTGGSLLRFGILILIWIRSLVFDTPMIWILALYLDF